MDVNRAVNLPDYKFLIHMVLFIGGVDLENLSQITDYQASDYAANYSNLEFEIHLARHVFYLFFLFFVFF